MVGRPASFFARVGDQPGQRPRPAPSAGQQARRRPSSAGPKAQLSVAVGRGGGGRVGDGDGDGGRPVSTTHTAGRGQAGQATHGQWAVGAADGARTSANRIFPHRSRVPSRPRPRPRPRTRGE
jgi:hypothetical protein